MTRSAKSSARLNRDIVHALVPSRKRLHHVDRVEDDWDVVMDAILQHDAKRAAKLVRAIRGEYGLIDATKGVLEALNKAPADVRAEFYALIDERDPVPPTKISPYDPLPHFYVMARPPSGERIWFKAAHELKKPGYKGVSITWHDGDRKPKKAKMSTIDKIDIDQKYYKQIAEQELPPEVQERIFEYRGK